MELIEPTKLKRRLIVSENQLNWIVEGEDGAIHIHMAANLRYGAIEIHSSIPISGKEPDYENCVITGKPCWSDGSSLWWSHTGRHLIADAIVYGDDSRIYEEAESWYRSRFKK